MSQRGNYEADMKPIFDGPIKLKSKQAWKNARRYFDKMCKTRLNVKK